MLVASLVAAGSPGGARVRILLGGWAGAAGFVEVSPGVWSDPRVRGRDASWVSMVYSLWARSMALTRDVRQAVGCPVLPPGWRAGC